MVTAIKNKKYRLFINKQNDNNSTAIENPCLRALVNNSMPINEENKAMI
ncbi:hypothetical protein MUTS5_16590 [Escherichia coli]|nr:hypothetical protein MUTS5_16590 [Escherichia coli]BEA92044.1 hypothetical protein VEE29_17090 [Escherichia coli]